MRTTQEYLQLLSEYKQRRGLFYGISRICIFGSVARGEQTEDSDVDVCVDLEVPSIFSLVHIKEELQQLFGCNVDVVRFRQNMDTLLKRGLVKSSKTISYNQKSVVFEVESYFSPEELSSKVSNSQLPKQPTRMDFGKNELVWDFAAE